MSSFWPIVIPSTLAIFAAIGYIDQRLALHQKQADPSKERAETIHLTIFFVLQQIVLAPILFCLFVITFGVISNLLFR